MKHKMQLIDSVDKLITSNELKCKQHPGITKPKFVEQPSWLAKTVSRILRDESIQRRMIYESGQQLAAHLHGRHPPMERRDMEEVMQKVREKLQLQDVKDLSIEDLMTDPHTRRHLKSHWYNWSAIDYDQYTSIAYLVCRSVPEYSVLYKIFTEIVQYDKDFLPKSLFDFGSGIGTVMWAASQLWHKSIKEYYLVDTSDNMINLSEYLIKAATPQINCNHIFYRQFLPASPIPTYDIVVSAYSLFELPNQKARLETISKLWQKTKKYLIIVEQGTRAGFELVNEARYFVLNYEQDARGAHVFSPCPHDLTCPRLTEDNTPCNFEIPYLTLPIGDNSLYKYERYSYVVLKKGKRPKDSYEWPRIVRPVLKRSNHTICRMCTASGKLEEQIFTKLKNGKNTYQCARNSEWGNRLPFQSEVVQEKEDPIIDEREEPELVESEKEP